MDSRDSEQRRGAEIAPSAIAATPGSALDPMIALSTSMHASPGVYALLIGSGVSTGAGVPTGWQVVQSLVQKVAVAGNPQNAAIAEAALNDPEGWWQEQGYGQLGYSRLLQNLAPTPAARQRLLATYFEPTEEDREQLLKVPGASHHAIAKLVARGSVRLILTTNFDRLIERVLEEAGISPQVIHRVEQIESATPLPHSRCTVVKLHGDYADLEQRNTIDELSTYPPGLDEFLRRVLDEYGLVVCGWSGEWDIALVKALEETKTRRYPLFWVAHGRLKDSASQLVAQHSGVVVRGKSADEFFRDLASRVEALDEMTTSPVSRAMAVSRLKKSLLAPDRRIEVFDLINSETSDVIAHVNDRGRHPLGGGVFEEHLKRYRADVDLLLHLLGTGIFHDGDLHNDLWLRTLERLMSARDRFSGSFDQYIEALRHYPGLLALWVSGVAFVIAKREDHLARLLLEPKWKPIFGAPDPQPAWYALHPLRILELDSVKDMARWKGTRWIYAESQLLRADCREPLAAIAPDDAQYEQACDRLEFLASLIAMDSESEFRRLPWAGLFMGEYRLVEQDGPLTGDLDAETSKNAPLLVGGAFGGDPGRAKAAKERLLAWVEKYRRWG